MESEPNANRRLDALARVHNLALLSLDETDLTAILGEIVDVAIAISDADFGNIQLLDETSSGLKIEAQRGFPKWWLDYWERTQEGRGTCGTALGCCQRIIVEDVERSPIFLGTSALEIQRRAGVRAVQSTPLVSRSGRPVGILSTHYRRLHRPDEHTLQMLDLLARQGADIIERQQDKTALRSSEERLKRILETDAVGLLLLDYTGTIIDANEGFLRKTGYTHAELQRRELTWRRITPPEWVKTTEQQFEDIANTGRIGPYEKECFLRDGSRRWMLYTGRDLGDGTILEFSLDITDRKRAEAARYQSEERYRSLVVATSAFVWIADSTGKFSQPQPTWESYTGQSWEQHQAHGWITAVHPNDRARIAEEWREAVATRSLYEVEWRAWHAASCQWRHCLTRGAPVLDSEGEVREWIAAVTDVHDRKMLEARQLHEEKLATLGVLAGGIAHDFNNLLGAVSAQAQLAVADHHDGTSPEPALVTIQELAIRGSEIVRQLMIYAGRESDTLKLYCVSRVIEEMLGLLRVSISKRATLETHLSQDLPRVRASGAQLRQIAMNLVINASDAIGDQDGVIHLTTSSVTMNRDAAITKGLAVGDYLQLEVSDNGEGMSVETRKRLFDPFFTTKPSGHGLGLAVVDGVVRSLRGIIEVESELGRGTTFRVLLPFTETTVVSPSDAMVGGGELASTSREFTLLVVEDERILRQAVVRLLRRTGFAVLEADNGTVAIDLLRSHGGKIDLILLDITIPGASSREVAAVAAEARPDLKVVLTSAYGEEIARTTARATQTCSFIRKPYQLGVLVQTLRNLVRRPQ